MSSSSKYLSPLMRAVAIGNVEIVQSLLEEGADVNERGPRESTALMYAAGGGHTEIVKMLVESGADVDAVEDSGCTALHHAEDDGMTEIIGILKSASIQEVLSVNEFRR